MKWISKSSWSCSSQMGTTGIHCHDVHDVHDVPSSIMEEGRVRGMAVLFPDHSFPLCP